MYIDKEIFDILESEERRQQITINLIASENYTSPEILRTIGSCLTDKYAEGYPHKRYYSGCFLVDQAETLAIERCKSLFNAEHVNVQPHSGSSANMAVYWTILNPGDTIMGMSLAEGGHLTHGHRVNFSGKLYKAIQYTVNPDTEMLDYESIEQLAQEHKPKLIICGASAYSRIIDFERFASIAKKNNAFLLADIAHIAGLIATHLHPSPIPYADFVTSTTHKTLRGPRGGLIMCKEKYAERLDKTIMPGLQGGPFMNIIAAKAVAFKEASLTSFTAYQQQVILNAQAMAKKLQKLGYKIVTNGTDNHLFVIDLRTCNINGNEAQTLLERVGITTSKSCIPFDPEKPWITSGIRIGTPAITTRGFQETDAEQVAYWIDEILKNKDNNTQLSVIKQAIETSCKEFPINR